MSMKKYRIEIRADKLNNNKKKTAFYIYCYSLKQNNKHSKSYLELLISVLIYFFHKRFLFVELYEKNFFIFTIDQIIKELHTYNEKARF